MLCPLCKVEMGISSSQHVIKKVEGEYKLFVRQILSCRNHNCGNYIKEVQTIENELPVLKE